MDVVNVILQPVVESLRVHVKKHIVFMTSCKKYVRDMEISMTELRDTRVDVKNRMEQQKLNRLKIPNHVPGWLEEVDEVDLRAESLRAKSVGTCFSFKTRHGVGKKADELIQEIKHLTEEHSRIVWPTQRIPLGQVDSMKASTSAPSVEYHSDFESREQTIKDALKALEADHKSHMIALCGMGGVGKTTMMEKMETVVKENRMFRLIVKVVIGEKKDPFAIQDAVADYLTDIDLKEKTIPARADKLRDWFKKYSEGGKKKILVILDDIWQFVDLNDIGLSALPNQGVDFKVLLTSRSRDVCKMMGVEADSIFNVKVLANAEAQRFFWKFIKDSDEADMDPDFRKIGDDIVRKCEGLPIAIKTIANTLKDDSKEVWEDTLTRLQNHDIAEMVNEVFEVSYENLKDEQTRSVLLLCGLYPEDFDIPTEELVRYGWGLKLFNKVYTIRDARNRLNTSIGQLVNANLLIESNCAGIIKMHDLVRAFVLNIYSKAEHASIVNHGNMSEWPANDTPDFWKRISLACKDMEEFPRDFVYPNLLFLKLTNGDKSLMFPENFYGLMEKLQVIVYEKMQYPSLPRSFEYSTNLRTLCLHECSLMFDSHSIGSLSNLEVLSFANCSIRKLPSTFKNLKKLKILDLTGCVNLRIDEGVLKNLVKLEELYMGVADEHAIRFTDGNFNELAERSKNLFAIEIEFFRNNAHPKRMSFNKLERFKISIGCFLKELFEKTTSFENTLRLASNKGELLESGINVLFEKTVVLHLKVDGMNDLEDLKCTSFHCLRVLKILKCSQLRYLFTRRVASTLLRLEHLEVWSCDTLQTLIHDEDSGSEPIKFPSLKLLSLGDLPKLPCLWNTGSVIELPQLTELRLDNLPDLTSIFPKEVAIPKLETLAISWMDKLNKIWSSEVAPSENVSFSMLKTIEVEECDRLVDVFPRNPMPLLHHLKQLIVRSCCSIETIFKIDMGCVREGSKSSLVSIVVENSENLRHVWSLKNVDSSNNRIIHGFEAVESIRILNCGNFRNVSTPITADFNLKALQEIDIRISSDDNSSPDQQNHIISRDLDLIRMDSMSHVWKFNWNQFFILQQPKLFCQNLTKITLHDCRSIKYLFSPLMFKFLSNLKRVHVEDCEVMEEIVSNRDVEDEEMATSTSNHTNVTFFPILETLELRSLESLQHIGGGRSSCTSIYNQSQPQEEEEVVALRWSLCQYSRRIYLWRCNALSSAIPSYALGHMQYLQELEIHNCDSMKYVFKIKSSCRSGEASGAGDNNSNTSSSSSSSSVVSSLTNTMILPDLRNLRRLIISKCPLLRDVFPFSTLQSLTKLEYLSIKYCDDIRVIVKEDGNHTTPSSSSSSSDHQVVVFPCLKSLYLTGLPKLVSFFLGTNDFQWPVLDRFEIKICPNMRMFTKGHSDSPMLKYVHSDTDLLEQPQEAVVPISSMCQYSRHIQIEKCHALSSAIPSYVLGHMQNLEILEIQNCDSMKDVFEIERVVVNDVTSSSSSCRPGEGRGAGDNTNSSVVSLTTNAMILTDLRNLRRLTIYCCRLLRDVFPFSTLQSLTKLESLLIQQCDIRVIVKEEEDGDHTTSSSSSDDHQVVVFPCLKSLELHYLPKLESFFLGTNDFQWPVLDTVRIYDCPKMRMFTKGHSDSPLLKYVRSDMGENSVECGLNNLFHEEVPYPSLDGSTSLPISERMPWFYNNLIKVHVQERWNRRFIIGHNELQHMQKIEKLRISSCWVKEIFETFEMNNGLNQTHSVVEVREMEFAYLRDIKCLWKSKQWTVLKFPNLTRLSIDECDGLKHVFTISMVGSLLQLQELHIHRCFDMETILADVEKDEEDEKQQDCENGKEDDDEGRVNEVEFPCLRTLTLRNLRSLKGFCLGIETIHWPSLDTLKIKECPEITTFTNGQSTTPKLKLINTSFGLCDAMEGVNSFIRTKIEEGYEFARW